MQAGSLTKRMVKLSRRLHKSMDGSSHIEAIAGKLDSIEKSLDDALAGVAARADEKAKAKAVGETKKVAAKANDEAKAATAKADAANETASLADKAMSAAKKAVGGKSKKK
jgi:hypothetical protein